MSAQTAAKLEESYNEVPYASFSHPLTWPGHVGALASLFGLTPPDLATARVLELGCATGSNLVPLALRYPEARFLGIDISPEQITQAQAHKKALGLHNIEFMQQDILAFSAEGKFDYIICHGILSWVPEPVQKGIFRLCGEYLSANGLAVISYNALPGWNAVRSLREMMLYHTADTKTPEEKISQSRALLDFLWNTVPKERAGYRSVIEEERSKINAAQNAYFYHDHLEINNIPLYLHEVARMANDSGLDYVGDTNLDNMHMSNLPPQALETLRSMTDIVKREQYMDFIANRRFRSSILCRSGQKITRNTKKEQILDYFLTANPALKNNGGVFEAGGSKLKPHNEISACLFAELMAAGQKPITAQELIARAQKKLGLESPAPVQAILVETGLQLFINGFIYIHTDDAPCVLQPGATPAVFPWARREVEADINRTTVTNVHGYLIPTDTVANIVVKAFDGTKTVEEVAKILARSGTSGAVNSGNALQITRNILQSLAKNALLTG